MVSIDLKEENYTNRVLFSAVCNHKIMMDCKRSKTGGGEGKPALQGLHLRDNRLGKALLGRV